MPKLKTIEILNGMAELLRNIEARLVRVESKLFKVETKLDEIDKRTQSYQKLYENVDRLVVEILENRNERTILNNGLNNHEQRLVALEKPALSG